MDYGGPNGPSNALEMDTREVPGTIAEKMSQLLFSVKN